MKCFIIGVTVAVGFFQAGSTAIAETAALEWAEQVEGQPPLPSETLLVTLGGETTPALVVSDTTEPKNLIAANPVSLYVENDLADGNLANRTRLWWRMLPFTAASSGKVTFSFRLIEGGFHVTVGHNPSTFSPGDPGAIQIADPDSIFLTMRLIVDEPVMVNSKNFQSASTVILLPDTDYTLGIQWDFEADVPSFEITLDGESLMPIEGADLQFTTVSDTAAPLGVNAFALSSTHARKSRYFLGPIRLTAD